MKKLSFFLMAMLISLVSFAAETTATLSFADKAQRTVFNSNQQVWTQNGITLTNDKASSTSNVADYAKPARFYKSSKITVACEGTIKQIVFGCNSTSYATALKSSITSGTATVSSDKVTVVPATESDTYVIASLTGGQVRMDELTVTYVAEEENPDATIYTITATSADETMGTVTGAGEYAEGKTVTLTANANPGYEFVKWSNESTENPLIFEATENVTITASFVAQTPITIAEAVKLADGATCILKDFTVAYVYKGYNHIQDETGCTLLFKYDFGLKAGDKVSGLTASKSTYNGLAQLAPTCALADLTVVAGEAPAVPEVTTAPTGNYQTVVKLVNVKMAAGSFTTSVNTTLAATCPDGTTINVYNNKNVTATFTADKTYNILGGISQYSSKIQVTAYAVEEYVAPVVNHTITVEANNTDWGTVEGGATVVEGEEITVTATPATGCNFVNWTVNDVEVSTDAEYTFTVEEDMNLVANFKKIVYTVTATAENGTIEGLAEEGKYEHGTTANLTAKANEGYEFVNWTEGETVVSTEANYSFAVLADRNLVANFKKSVVTHDFYAEGVTVSEGSWSINLSGSWNEQAFTVMLWQDNTQGFGTYAANAETGYTATLGVKELTPTEPGYYTDMQDGTFTFQGTMTDGTDIYEVYLKGALASSTGTGEMEAKDDVAFSYDADGVWTIEAYADDVTWGLYLNVAQNLETMEWIAEGYYITDPEASIMEEVAGTGLLYFDDFSGHQVFKGTLTTTSGEIYPTLYASSLTLMTNDLITGPSWVGEFAGVDYYEVLMMAADYSWELDLHARECTGANGTYTVDVVDEAEGAYSTFMGNTIVAGELTIEDGMYEAYVTTVDSEGNPAMSISVLAWAAAAEEYDIVITDATVTDNTSGYNIDLTGEWEGHTIKVEVCDELTAETILANFFIDGGIANDGDQAEGTVEATVSEGVVTITGTFECLGSGNVYNVTISGTLPVEEPEVEPYATIAIDGDNADWAEIPMLTEPGVGPVVKMLVPQKGVVLPEGAAFALMVEGEEVFIKDTYPKIYVDADHSKETTLWSTSHYCPNFGLEYEMATWSKETLYKQNADLPVTEMCIMQAAYDGEIGFDGKLSAVVKYKVNDKDYFIPSGYTSTWEETFRPFVVEPTQYVYNELEGKHTAAGVYTTHPAVVMGESLAMGPNDSAKDTAMWAAWTVELTKPAIYNVKLDITSTSGWSVDLYLVDTKNNNIVATFTGNNTWTQIDTETVYGDWDLTAVPAGKYVLKAKNHVAWSNVAINAVTLDIKPGTEVGTGFENIQVGDKAVKIVRDGQVFIIRDNKVFNVLGQSVK